MHGASDTFEHGEMNGSVEGRMRSHPHPARCEILGSTGGSDLDRSGLGSLYSLRIWAMYSLCNSLKMY